jgi:hypothetical protein
LANNFDRGFLHDLTRVTTTIFTSTQELTSLTSSGKPVTRELLREEDDWWEACYASNPDCFEDKDRGSELHFKLYEDDDDDDDTHHDTAASSTTFQPSTFPLPQPHQLSTSQPPQPHRTSQPTTPATNYDFLLRAMGHSGKYFPTWLCPVEYWNLPLQQQQPEEPQLTWLANRTQLEDGREAVIIDSGAFDNMCGDQWVQRLNALATTAGYPFSTSQLREAIGVAGVGAGPQQTTTAITATIALEDGSWGTFKAPVLPNSPVPALLGLKSIERNNGVIDARPGKQCYYFSHNDLNCVTITPNDGCQVLPLYKTRSGHLAMPVTEYVGPPSSKRRSSSAPTTNCRPRRNINFQAEMTCSLVDS